MLRTRIATAIVLAIIVLSVLFAMPPVAGVGLVALMMLAGAWEWARFAGLTRLPARLGYVLATGLAGALAWFSSGDWPAWQWLMAAAALWWLVAFAWLALAPAHVNRTVAGFAGLCTLVPAWVGLGRLLEHPAQGSAYVFYLLLVVWAADIGAYFAGRRFGRVKLAPAVSPNKTWEGLGGGVALGAVVASVGARYFGVRPLPFIALGLALVLASVVGDLTESMFKRAAGLKDSGSLLPGHGGILDRIDSITSSVPFFVLGLGWLGVLG